MKNYFAFFLFFIGLIIFIFVVYKNSNISKINRIFSPYSILSSSWEKYKLEFINNDGRVIDYSQGDVTTSEGQSYALLRAVWIDDKPTFDLAWKWTKENLKRTNDSLFVWRWGKREDGKYGFLSGGGDNSASDADSDIALALIFASRKWSDKGYEDEAKKILSDFWKVETDLVLKKRYVVAGSWAKEADIVTINPSYFSPYAWRIFHDVDKDRDWLSLIDPAYEILDKIGKSPLDKDKGVGLPPDWFAINRKSGEIEPSKINNLKSDYSFDAMRLPFRIGLDYLWFNESRAKSYLTSSFEIIRSDYIKNSKLPASYSHNGSPLNTNESPSMYATALSYFVIRDLNLAKKLYQEKIIRVYAGDKDTFDPKLPYYDQNWLWFGTAFYNNFLKKV